MSKIYVNAAWTGDIPEGYDAAYTSFAEALANITADTDAIDIIGDISEAGPAANTTVTLSKDLTVSGGNITWSTLGGWIYFTRAEGSDAKVIFDGFKLDSTVATKAFFFNADAVIKANSAVSVYNAKIYANCTVNVEAGGEFNVYKEELQIDADAALAVKGKDDFSAANAELADRQVFLQYSRNVKGNITVENSFAASYQGFYIKDNGSITVDNSLIQLGTGADGVWHYNPVSNGYGELRLNSETAVLDLTNGSIMEISGNVINSGTINIDGSTFNVNASLVSDGVVKEAQNTNKVTNNNIINVSGESTLNIRELAGNALTFDNATLVDSNIKYTGSNSFGLNGVTFKGANVIDSAAFATSGAKFTVAEDGSFKAVGGRFAFGGNAEWNINGSIKDVKALSDDEKAKLTASLDVSGISMSTGGGEAVMNVKNAYFTYGSGAITTKNTNTYGGKMTMNFENSYVASAYKISVNPTKAGYDAANAPEVAMNFTGSVVEINNYFTNNHAKGTVTIDNSDFTATAFGNVGTFTVRNDSNIKFSLVNNALGDWAGKGSLNAGTMTIDNSDLTIVNKTVSLEFYNVGTISLTNGATLTLDRLDNAMANDLAGAGNINTTFADQTGSITIDAASKLIVNDYFNNDGTITIDAANFAGGIQKVIDLNIENSLKGSVNIINLGEGVSAAYGKDGDVFLTDASMEKIYVNTAYADKAFGTVDGDKVYGVNAFGSLLEAVDAKTATSEIVIESDISEALSGGTVSGKITADKAVTVADSANSGYVNLNGTEIGKNVTVDAKYFYLYGENTIDGTVKSSSTFYSSGKLILNGNATVYTTMSRYYGTAEDGIYIVGTAAANEGKNAAAQYTSINYLGHYSGTFSVKDTAAEFGYILLNGSNDGDIQAKLVLDNASVKTIGGPNTQPGQVLMNDDAAIIATNDSVLDFRGPKDFGYLSMEANNSINLTDSALLLGKDGQGTNNLNGKITLVNSELSSLGTLNNGGTITIDGTSTITATKINNTGTITIDLKGYTGDTVKVIDLTQDSKLTGVTVKNTGNNYYLTYGDDGDVTVNKSPEFIYVSSDYNSSTEGWGVTKFNSWDGAYAFSSVNAKKATMVFEKLTTISGNCFPKQADGIAAVIVKDGVAVGNANSKWDAVFAMTIEGGGILQSARPASAGYGNTHVKNKWIIGEADSEKRAEIRFINGKSGIAYKTMSIALLSGLNRSITANNALIEVGDFGINAKADFTDTILTIDGILAIKGTSLYKTTMTDTNVTIKGHNLMNENTYYSTVGTILATLTMDNTSITVDDGVDETAAEKVWLGYTGNVAQTLTLTNGSSITIEKDAEVAVANKVSVTGSSITAGTVDASVTKAGNSSFYFNQLEKGKVYYAVLYDAEGNELETIVRTSTSGSTFYPKFSVQPVGDYKAVCYKDEAKTEIHQEKTYTFTAVGTVDLVNSDFNAETLKLAGNNFNMDIDSTVSFKEITGGYVTVSNADSYAAGNYNLFDYTGEGSMTEDDYKAILGDVWHDNYKVLWNDLYLTDQAADTIYVNAEWAAAENGDTVGDGYLYGYNAFASLDYAVADETQSVLVAGGTYSQTEGVYNNSVTVLKGNVNSFEADSKVTVDLGSLVFATEYAGDVYISGEYETTDKIRYTGTWGVDWTESQNGHIRFVGGDETVFNIDGTFTSGENIQFIGGTAVISEDSVLSVNPANWGQYLVNGANVTNYGSMSLNLNGLNGSAMNILNGGSLTVSGENASLSINMKDGGADNKDINVTNGSLTVENGATVTVTGTITVGTAGTVVIDNAAINGLIANSGTVELNGEVTLNAGSISGNAAVDEDGDALLNLTGFEFTENGQNLINFDASIDQILSVNGNAVDMVGELYIFAEGEAVYTLTQTDAQITVDKWDVKDITVSVESVSQTEGTYDFTFTVTADGATDYTLVIDGVEVATSTDGIFELSNDEYEYILPDSFNYYVVATGKDALGNDTYGKSEEATFEDIADYTAPWYEDLAISSADDKQILEFTAGDNRAITSAVIIIDGKEFDISNADGSFTYDVSKYAGSTYTVILTDDAGNSTEFEGTVATVVPDKNGNLIIAPVDGDEQVIVTVGATETTAKIGTVNVGGNVILQVTGDLTAKYKNVITLGQNSGLDVTGNNIEDVNNFYSANQTSVTSEVYNATEGNDSFNLGVNSTAEFGSMDMLEGYDTVYIGNNAEFKADSVAAVEEFSTASGSTVEIGTFTGSDASSIIIGSNAALFTAESIEGENNSMSVNFGAAVELGEATLNKLSVGNGVNFKAETLNGTDADNKFSFGANSIVELGSVDFGDGYDTLALSGNVSVFITGTVENLEAITGNFTNTIYLVGGSISEDIKGYNNMTVVKADIMDAANGTDSVDLGQADIFKLASDETLTLSGDAVDNGDFIVKYYSTVSNSWYIAKDYEFSGADASMVKIELNSDSAKEYTFEKGILA